MFIPVIVYHSVAPEKNEGWIKKYLTLELRYFEDQIKYLRDRNFKTVFLDEYFDVIRNGKTGGEKYICINFDDGFLDNWIYVFPVLKKYGFKATIFISPEFVDQRAVVRKTLEDYWSGNASLKDIERWGYLSWEEMELMESSDLVDIQSHTMSHTELFVSDKIIDFHHPGSQYLHPIGNLYPERKPYYIDDPEFEKLLPYGYPFFESAASVIAKRVEINQDFINDVIKELAHNHWKSYRFNEAFKQVEAIYLRYKNSESLITKRETCQEYDNRLLYELKGSKDIIEKKLHKQVKYLCWPNIKYNQYTHLTARKVGYEATVIKLGPNEKQPPDRFSRISITSLRTDSLYSRSKARFKLHGMHRVPPFNYFYVVNQKIKRMF